MKYNYNETTLVTGCIKELLHEFNLPSYRVYRDDLPLNDGRFYIRGNNIVKYENSSLIPVNNFYENKTLLNITSKLALTSTLYDTYTHEYLGDYLRFKRDYYGINLMPLYNCLTTETPIGLNFSIGSRIIDSDDSNYVFYMAKVRFDEDYTIAIDCDTAVEMFTTIYTGDDVLSDAIKLARATYKKYNSMRFMAPVKYSKLKDLLNYTSDNKQPYKDFWQQGENIRLIIKVPKSCTSSVVVLEGNYTEDRQLYGLNLNHIVNNMASDGEAFTNCRLSLLETNDKRLHPFADRLVEYLLGQAVIPGDVITNNVYRIQKAAYSAADTTFSGWQDVWDSTLTKTIYNVVQSDERIKQVGTEPAVYLPTNVAKINVITGFENSDLLTTSSEDVLENNLKQLQTNDYILEDSGYGSNFRHIDLNRDLLCYGDKNIEQIIENLSGE